MFTGINATADGPSIGHYLLHQGDKQTKNHGEITQSRIFSSSGLLDPQ